MQRPLYGERDEPIMAGPASGGAASLPEPWRVLLSGRCGRKRHRHPAQLGFFIELIQDDDAPAAHLEAAPVWLSSGAHGQAKAAPLDRQQLTSTRLGVAEQRLAAGVLGLPSSTRRERHYAHLNGRIGDALLAEMLDTAPCFLGGVAGLHLARGKTQTLAWRWMQRTDGDQQLVPQIARNRRLLRIGTLWYLDAERAELGMLTGDDDAARLLEMPLLAPQQSAAFAAALGDSPLAARLPAPHVFDPPRSIDATPRPVLALNANKRPASRTGAGSPLGYARLRFDYAGVSVSSREEGTRRVRRGKLVDIRRRRAEELAAMEHLESCGLRPAVDTEGLPWEVAQSLPEDAWLFPGKGHAGALEVNTPSRWLSLRERFEHDGFALDYAPTFPFEVIEAPVRWYANAREMRGHHRFELELGVEVEGKRINLLPAVSRALDAGELTLQASENEPADLTWYAPLDARRRLPVSVHELRTLIASLADHLQHPAEHIRLPRVQAGRLDELTRALPDPHALTAPAALGEFTTRLRQAASRPAGKAPADLAATLRPYQHEGLRWLNALAAAGIGGVLADDMGLGKTLQVLAHMLALRAAGELDGPVLVVAPTSLIPNWESESARFAPSLSRLTLSGPQRGEHFEALDQHELILTSYALVPRDLAALKQYRYALVVLDEAQQVKNPRTHARRAVLKLKTPRRLCMTGTPLENHLGELWSQLDLAVPGLLGEESAFRQHYRIPIEKYHDEERQQRLNRRLAPFILRRTKAEVATELPPKTEVTRQVILYGRQRQLYATLRDQLAEELHEVIAERGIERAGIVVLDALLKLRQVCCDPRLVKTDEARGVHESAKFELLMQMLPALLAEGRRVLVFSQFTEMLKLIAAALDHQRIAYVTLTGDTRDRAEPVRRFQDGEVPLFLLSLRAGGVGLNLTAADAVIHYDPWWNPAAEAQASDRAHRIGQDKPVIVYRLITAGTVEERIEAMKARKAELAAAVLAGGGTSERLRFDQGDLDALLAPG
jgi:superfamily II DNA or RNA helicase